MQHLATWSGIVSESAAPFEAINDHVLNRKNDYLWDGSNSPYPSSLAYGHNELILEESVYYNALNPAILKQMVYQYGACTVAMEFDYHQYMNLEEHNPETGKAYEEGRSFYNDTGEVSADHALTLVGWDDNYPKENFRRRVKTEDNKTKVVMPEKDGAWIIQNSWGDCHEHGFLYASYESADFNVDDVQVIAFDMQSPDTYDYNFQYDGTAGIADTNGRSEDGRRMPYRTTPGTSAANMYTNTTGHPIRLEAVGYTTYNLGQTDYDVSVYTGLTDPNDPCSGTLWGTTRISSTKAGCKTGRLDQSVVVKPGETFSFVFQFPDFTAFGVETTYGDSMLLINAQTDPGQSFFKPAKSGSGWKDMDDYDACFRIKGFASACTYDLSGEQVVFSKKVSGKTKKPEILSIGGMQLQEGKDYTAKWSGLTVRIQGKGDYTGTTQAVWEAGKAANPMTVQGKTASVSYKALSKKNQTLAATKLFRVSGNQGKVSYQKTAGNANILIASNGKVTVKKGLKKNTYTVKAKVTAAGNDSYRSGTKTVKIKIIVK